MADVVEKEYREIIPTPFYKHYIGIDEASSLTDMPEEASVDSLNFECTGKSRLDTRPGCEQFLAVRLSDQSNKIFDFQRTDGSQFILAWSGAKVQDITSGTPVDILTGAATPNLVPGVTVNNDACVWGDGINPNKKFNGTDVWNLSVPAALAFPTLNTAAAGSITTVTGQKYVITFYNATSAEEGNPFSVDDLSGAPDSGVINLKKVVVTRPAVPGGDPQVSHWRIYKTEDGGGVFKRHAEVPIASTDYDDNILLPATTIELETDNDEAPLSEHFAEFQGSIFLVPINDKTALRFSKVGNNSAYPPGNEEFAGYKDNDFITGIKNKNNLLWIMKKYSAWVLPNHPADGGVPIKIADRGSVNKNAFDGSDQSVLSFAANGSVYKYQPTDFGLSEIRYQYRSENIQTVLDGVNKGLLDKVRCVNFSSKTKNQVFFAIPAGSGAQKINKVVVYDMDLAKQTQNEESWWPFRFMFDITSMDLARVDGEDVILFGDDVGNVFKFPTDDGDGAQENGTSTGGGAADELIDTTQAWDVDAHKGLYCTIIEGMGAGQERKILSNTADTNILATDWATLPDNTSKYTIGGYHKEYLTNWKNFGIEGLRKVMRYIRVIARQGGDFDIDIIFRRDFQSSTVIKTLNTAGLGSLWNQVFWGLFLWGAASVVRQRLKFSGKFNSCQIGFRNRLAGQNFSIEGYTTHHQNLYLGTKQ